MFPWVIYLPAVLFCSRALGSEMCLLNAQTPSTLVWELRMGRGPPKRQGCEMACGRPSSGGGCSADTILGFLSAPGLGVSVFCPKAHSLA